MKTPEEMAEEYARCEGNSNETHEEGLREGFLAGYQAAKDQVAHADKVIPQWISVKDRLPRPGQEVLAFDNGIMRVQAISDHGTWHPYVNGAKCNPSHWMELPEAPKEEK